MDLQPWALYFSIFLTAIILLLKFIKNRRCLNLPPGPKPYPIIGNLNIIGALPHRSIHKLSLKYGPIMQLKFGSFPIVMGSSIEAVRFFLKTHDLIFASRPKLPLARKMCLTELFSVKRVESYEYVRVEELHNLLRELFKSSNKTIMLKDFLSTASLNVISRMVLGKKYLDEGERAVVTPEEFKKMMDKFFLLNGVLNIGDLIPWLDFLDMQGYVKRMKVLSKKFDRFLEHVLDEHDERRKKEGERFVAKDMVDVLQFADDPGLDVKLSIDGVKACTQSWFNKNWKQMLVKDRRGLIWSATINNIKKHIRNWTETNYQDFNIKEQEVRMEVDNLRMKDNNSRIDTKEWDRLMRLTSRYHNNPRDKEQFLRITSRQMWLRHGDTNSS